MKGLILRIAWRNIWRNARRTWITLTTMIICCGFMVWMITVGDGSHHQMIRSALNFGLGSIQIHADGYFEDHAVEKTLTNPDSILEIARETPGIEGASVRLTTFGLVSAGNASQGGAIIGVDPVEELSISVMDEKIVEGHGEWLPPEIENERRLPIVIGSGLAQKLDVDVGDRVFLTLQRFTGEIGYAVYFVHGVFTTGMGEQDKSVAYVPIDTLREAMGTDVERFQNSVHEVTVLLEPNADEDEAVEYLNTSLAGIPQELEIMTWQELQPGLQTFIEIDDQSMYIFMVFMFVVVAAGIMNTFLMAVFERIREFGIFMSLGTRPSAIFSMVMIESAIVGLLGAIGGLAFGMFLVWINTIYPWNFEAYSDMGEVFAFDWSMKIYPMIVWTNVTKALIGIFVVTILAALWPAIKAALLKPVEALRHV